MSRSSSTTRTFTVFLSSGSSRVADLSKRVTLTHIVGELRQNQDQQASQLPTRLSSGSLTTVDRVEFLRLRTALTTNLPPASGALLDAAASRLRRRLVSSVMFGQVEVEITEDP